MSVTAVDAGSSNGNSTYFVLSFGGEVTGPILANANDSCEPAVSEVQVISATTSGAAFDAVVILRALAGGSALRLRMHCA